MGVLNNTISLKEAARLDKLDKIREDLKLPMLVTEIEEGEYVPNSEGRAAVWGMLLAGSSVKNIAKVFGFSPSWVKQNFAYEILTANDIANGTVAQALYTNATENMDVNAQKFWLKSKAGWRETKDEVDNPVLRIQPVLNISIAPTVKETEVLVNSDKKLIDE